MAYKKCLEKKKNLGVAILKSKKDEMLGDVTEAQWIDFMSVHFKSRVEEKLKRLHCLDDWLQSEEKFGQDKAISCIGEKEKNDSKAINQAKIEQQDLEEDTKVFVVRNALSNEMVHELREEINRQPFMPYYEDEEMEQRKGRRIRIVSEKYSEFIVGKGPKSKRFGSADISNAERKLLLVINEFLKIYTELFKKVLGIELRIADQLQEVKDCLKNGGYKKHNDQSGLCCHCPGEINSKKDKDSPEHMLVVTYVLSNVEMKNTKVSWGSGENDTASIQTGHNDIHFQAINCQTKFTHKVDAISRVKKRVGYHDYRLVFSAR